MAESWEGSDVTREGRGERGRMAVAVRTNALFKKKTAAAAPAKKGKKAPAKRAAPAKKGKKAAPAKEGSSLLGGLTDMFSTNADTLESRARSGSTAKGAQRFIGYRGSGQVGSAPQVDAQARRATATAIASAPARTLPPR